MLDSFTVWRIESVLNGYIHEKVPAPLRTMVKLTYRVHQNELILTEERPAEERYRWDKLDIARFEWDEHRWKVFAKDEHDRWNTVDAIEPCQHFEDLLEQVERDEAGVFWR
ncbi:MULTISPECIES: DUF3024 domain-containing protein [unclassified Paenibacillus]|uniref:DUF3024 domain-containing protein n=1 Tax=unclassified Paenibacillus TaxID=185978 RepID=UPI000FE1FBC1|nr:MULTISPECIES: DUF3024 domain-containing protein [unclassified Paenibacillus]MCM3175122.1 DUF3024 domain-containing protein [Paenibacillus sp. MER 99-2]